MDLKKISFGRDTAEFDRNLTEYFLRTPTYTHVIEGHRAIVTGRKGTGKTALLRYCQETENPSHQYVITIEASHSTYVKIDENLRGFTSQIKNLDSSFKLGWLFTTLLALVDRLVAEKTMYVSKDERDLYDLAQKEFHYSKDDPIAALSGYIFNWIGDLKKIGPIERKLDTSRHAEVFDEPRLVNLIRAAIQRVNQKGKKVLLFYDKLDERWDGTPLHTAFLQGLLLAVREIKATGLDVAPVVLLRDDIFDAVTADFQHIDHFRMEIEPLTWDERSLMDLIALRVSTSLSATGTPTQGMSAEELWAIPFPEKIPARKQAIPTYAYMIERTLFRPRDIILFANLVRDATLKNRRNQATVDDIAEAETQYSQMKLRDLIAEMSYKYPRLDNFLTHFRKSTIGFDIDDLRILVIQAKEAQASPPPWMVAPEDDIIRVLYTIGFLAYTTRGGVLRGTRVVHSAVDSDPDTILSQKRAYVSPIFRRALELRDH